MSPDECSSLPYMGRNVGLRGDRRDSRGWGGQEGGSGAGAAPLAPRGGGPHP